VNIEKVNLSEVRQFVSVFLSIFFALTLESYSSLSFVRLIWGKTQINVQLTDKISLKFDFSLSLLLEYSR